MHFHMNFVNGILGMDPEGFQIMIMMDIILQII